uniref:Chloride channel protein n=1 Tax=Arcella intermedia TaxID=1963864 RepID=A0A6B2KYD2_9EUKA
MNETWLFLMLLGFSCALLGVACDTAMRWLVEKRREWSSWEEIPFFANYVIWVLLGILYACVSAFCVAEINPHSSGSGMPSIKSILSGLILPQYLSIRCLVAKTIGVIGTIAAGLACGKEGPYVHMCAMLAYQLTRIPIFKRIRKNNGIKIQMLGAGCAAGFGVTFGAPIGGVLYSIETTSTYYFVQNLWKAFFCAFCATALIKLLGSDGLLALFVTEFNSELPYTTLELLFFIIAGFLYGLAGALFVFYVEQITLLRKKYKILQRPYLQAILTATVTGVFTFPLDPLRKGQSAIIGGFFVNGPMMDWQSPNILFNLTLFTIISFILCGYTICIPIVSGLFTPTVILGASSGRLLGELMNLAFPALGINPGGYAVVGAAAFSAGVTRTVASGIIVFELTGQMTHLLPVLMTVLIAASVGNFFTLSVYDTLLREKGLPYIPAIKNSKLMKKTVGYVMTTDMHLLTTDMNYHDLQHLLKNSEEHVYPLVNNKDERIFLCQIQRFALERHLFKQEISYRQLVTHLEDSSSDSSDDDHAMADNLKVIGISIDADLERRRRRHKEEKRERRRRRKEKKLKQKEKELLAIQQKLEMSIQQAKLQGTSEAIPGSPSPLPLESSADIIAQFAAEKSVKKLKKLEKLEKKQKTIPSKAEYFSSKCGFDNLAKYLASHGTAGHEELQGPVALDPERFIEGEGDNSGVDLCPYTVMETSPLSKVHFMFAVMGLSHIWVVREGRLMGLVAKENLMNMEKKE